MARQLRAVLRHVNHEGATATLALVLRAQGRFDESIALFNDLLAHDSLINTLHQELGITYQCKGDEVRAAEHYAASIRTAPSLFDPYFRLAEHHGRQGNRAAGLTVLRTAEAQLRTGIRREPSPYLYGMLGLALREQGRFSEAAASFKTALAGSTTPEQQASLHERLGTTFYMAGDREQAKAHYRLALRMEPNNRMVRDGLRRCE